MDGNQSSNCGQRPTSKRLNIASPIPSSLEEVSRGRLSLDREPLENPER
uniref:Uncharacterized protein n=1 Tax=Nelumbo nucifera TaxID=4432 RepID=A0A822ZBY4_NELNU|nr:TPA_asm: hypothetical protein HUJ06_000872 [Nelumbo nucifera]